MNDSGALLINKPEGYTSFDIVREIKKKFKTKKVGHTGTLDPMATGVLVVCINSGTKIIEYLVNDDKEYDVILRLGCYSETLDRTEDIIPVKIPETVNENKIKKTILSFLGESEQLPPMYSAKKIKGKRLYEYARQGIKINRKTHKINIKNIKINSITFKEEYSNKFIDVNFVLTVSKGTYIRVLCYDIGKKLGTSGIMQELCRTRVGKIKLKNTKKLNKIDYNDLVSIDKIVNMNTIILPLKNIKRFMNGCAITYSEISDYNYSKYVNQKVIVKSKENVILGIADITTNKYKFIQPRKVFK